MAGAGLMKRLLVAFLFALPVLGQTAIPIQNPSFEAPVNLTEQTACGQGEFKQIPSWTVTQGNGGGSGVIAFTCEAPPDGKQVAYLQSASISQDLGIPLKDGGYTYTLKFWVASWFYWYPGKYKVSFSTGITELCSTSGYAAGDFAEIPLVCVVPYYVAHYNGFKFPPGNIVISLAWDEYWPLVVDNVSLTFTPSN